MNLQEQIAYIAQRQEDARRFSAEMRATSVKDDQSLSPLPIFFAGFFGGGACFLAGMAFGKLIGV